jgi:hypothetical protein
MGSDAGRTLGMIGLGLGGAMLGGWLLGPTIGVGLGYLGGSFVGQMLFPTKTKMGMPAAAQYPTQQAMKGQSIPIGYGTNRVAGNMIWLGDLQTYTVEQGGKGGGPEVEQTMYYRSFCFALCEGERHVLRGWAGKHEIAIGPSYSYEGEAVSIDEGKVRSAFGGAIQQEVTIFEGDGVNSGLADLIGEDYVEGYKDLPDFADSELYLGSVAGCAVWVLSRAPRQPTFAGHQLQRGEQHNRPCRSAFWELGMRRCRYHQWPGTGGRREHHRKYRPLGCLQSRHDRARGHYG